MRAAATPPFFVSTERLRGCHGQVSNHQDQAAKHGRHRLLLCHEEESPEHDRENELPQVRPGRAQARRVQGSQDKVDGTSDAPPAAVPGQRHPRPIRLTALALSDRRLPRVVALLGALLLLGTFAPLSLYHPPRFTHAAVIAFDPVPLDEDAPQRSRIGSLVFLQGWALRSDNPGFGGISALHVDGRRVTGLSDTGVLSRFDLPDGGAHAVRGRLDPLPDGPGPPTRKSNRDSESMLVFDGHLWVGFERHNEIWRYASGDWHRESHAAPPAMKHWPNNTGPEAMVRLDDGRFLLFAENAPRGDGTSEVVLFDGDPAVPGTRTVTLGYRPPDGYRATDAALLPDGRILILNRRVSIWEGF